jgi:DnaJ-class molecular chaperone
MSKKKLPLAQEGEAIVEYETCPRCRGTGRGYGIDDCGKCNGAGRIPLAK